ncbi:PPOX class F420-dependent oxidoreductase (plasmid) [Haloferax mediterranei ATCC 33500]|uniref:PPOX class F420-dependent oxidoreductase n=1 Tax=Haloferax mediterranei (strain ATCC 33500 / DSM 1411 / JCM 8866 / NBRC 14739 / NCIMB 2177 / R-4) TaxID=523841 RepID=I3RAC1_HALMT|nr:PPOX class F420-dependent oxidoreductase [Haloferax mediterranei]AFK21181.1 Pyridoxamine 5'-phosphate oxidase [Haloferax mediterranei ATCC 33500]ELZ97483.1 Pyridoxamine 5'-phosphate oxidase [Haloferax mediterranei ATCC 33500]MDX5990225.1 PPOX class F420-dependent oxidoreductase [Haloferax mediterranei ATCC 33500]QCQ76705.1 PPOX class F420-dependent oxidoreductase [Haloferax mediterranei ATCC 33500]
MASIPVEFQDLFERGAPVQLATVLPDGMPHVTPVFAEYDGEHVLFNTMRGRRKERNIRNNPNVGVSVTDPDDPYRYLSISGEVVGVTEDGAVEHVHHIARKFMDVPEYPNLDDEPNPRVVVRIRPVQVRAIDEPERSD